MAHVLLIEPDQSLARTYVHALQHTGYIVQATTTAQHAIQAADETRPDVVLVELQLVAHSGVEFLYEFRSYTDWQDIPVIILSNVPPGEFHHSAGVLIQHLGVSAYCYKPQTTLKHLIKTVESALGQTA